MFIPALFLKCLPCDFLAQRARSASRKRGHDETEEPPNPSGSSSAYRLQYQLGFGRTNLSPHSSPTSAKSYPSPPLPHNEPSLERSPPIVNAPSFGSWNGPVSPVGGVPSPVRYEFDFSLGRGPFGPQQSTDRWAYDGEPFPSTSQNMLPTGAYELPSTVDPSYLAYGGPLSQLSSDFFGTSTAPQTNSLLIHGGLPFHGLDYIRNFDPDGGEQDALGQGFDAGAFQYDPEIPFTLPDLATEHTSQ